MAMKLNSKHFAKVYSITEYEGKMAILMEYISFNKQILMKKTELTSIKSIIKKKLN